MGKSAPCSGNGRCISLRTATTFVDLDQFDNATGYSDWDADMVHGCDCDDGWEGSSCSYRTCPKGDNPTTPGQDESQLIDCTCTAYNCSGSFQFGVRGQKTQPLPLNATEELIKMRIEVMVARFTICIF